MHLVELFVPLNRGDGSPVKPNEIQALVRRLADRFGGATAFSRAPADGLWKDGSAMSHDRIVIIEGHGRPAGSEVVGSIQGGLGARSATREACRSLCTLRIVVGRT